VDVKSGTKPRLLDLSLREFLEKTNRERPQITGGCVLLTSASLNAAMILMALKISLKRSKEAERQRLLRKRIKSFSGLQTKLVEAAALDLQVFDEYRLILKSRAKNRQSRLNQALENATDSLLDVCKTLEKCCVYTEAAKAITDPTVVSDIIAGQMIFEAIFSALIALAEGNIASMPAEARLKYERWKEALQPS
jgi:formiminotetrahydrofolate cyclodeaminase